MYTTQGLHRSVQQNPAGLATVQGDRCRTFAQLADRVSRLAAGLRAAGAGAGDRIGYLGLNSDRFVEYYLAVAWAGAVAVPLNTRWASAEAAFALADSGARVLVVDDAFTGMIDAVRAQAPGVRVLIHAGDGPAPDGWLSFDELATRTDPVPDGCVGGDALAGIFYTGGTTGVAKGVMLSHANLLTSALGSLAAGVISPGSRFLHVAPMFHIADYGCSVSVTATGGTHVVLPGFDPVAVLTAIERHQITDLGLIPIMLQMLVDHPDRPSHDLTSLRSIMYGGSSITAAVLRRVLAALPGTALVQAFGQTESSPVLTWLGAAEHADANRPELLRSAGRAALHTEVRIVDPDGSEVPRGRQGEIVARGGNVMLGYWNRPEETASALRPGPGGTVWLHTGDVGRMDDDGYLFVLDRIKDMIVSGGENVFSAEVENAVALHPGVAACAVIGLPDERWGETVHAVVVPAPGPRPGAEEIRAFARERIAGYKVPRTVEFVDALPVSAAGKVLKRDLRAARVPAGVAGTPR